MTDREKYFHACNFAVKQLTDRGSVSVLLGVHSDHPAVVQWKDVLEWLDKERQEEVNILSMLTELRDSIYEDSERRRDSLFGDGERYCLDIIDKKISSLRGE